MKVAVVGATGLVGNMMIKVLEERNFPVSLFMPVASEKSVGNKVSFNGNLYDVISMQSAIDLAPDVALFSAGGSVSLSFAEQFAAKGAVVIDNSSAWRMHENIKLVVPEVNGEVIDERDKIFNSLNLQILNLEQELKLKV